jgi:hypothetical protein
MCLNCGCGEYQRRHKPSDITLDDLATAAKGRWMEIREAAANLQDAGRAIERENDRQESQNASV